MLHLTPARLISPPAPSAPRIRWAEGDRRRRCPLGSSIAFARLSRGSARPDLIGSVRTLRAGRARGEVRAAAVDAGQCPEPAADPSLFESASNARAAPRSPRLASSRCRVVASAPRQSPGLRPVSRRGSDGAVQPNYRPRVGPAAHRPLIGLPLLPPRPASPSAPRFYLAGGRGALPSAADLARQRRATARLRGRPSSARVSIPPGRLGRDTAGVEA